MCRFSTLANVDGHKQKLTVVVVEVELAQHFPLLAPNLVLSQARQARDTMRSRASTKTHSRLFMHATFMSESSIVRRHERLGGLIKMFEASHWRLREVAWKSICIGDEVRWTYACRPSRSPELNESLLLRSIRTPIFISTVVGAASMWSLMRRGRSGNSI